MLPERKSNRADKNTPDISDFNHLLARSPNVNPFPLHVFPDQIQGVIASLDDTLHFKPAFTGSAMLYAASVAIGNSYRIHNSKYAQSALLYICLVGRSGLSKTHPFNWALKPIEMLDTNAYERYKVSKREYDIDNQQPKPVFKQHIVRDFTIESIPPIHEINDKGIGAYRDELKGFFDDFNKYRNGGSDEAFWIQNWDNQPITVNRKNMDNTTRIDNPFISIGGSTQPNILKDICKPDRSESGFMQRWLFTIVEDTKVLPWSDQLPDPEQEYIWNGIIEDLIKDDFQENQTLHLTDDAKLRIVEFQRELAVLSTNSESDVVRSIYSKMEQYTSRLALILQLLHVSCKTSTPDRITLKAMNGGIDLARYFIHNSLRVLTPSSENILDEIKSKNVKDWIECLPEEFETKTAIGLGMNKFNLARKTAFNYLADRRIFEKPAQGKYLKAY